MKLKLLLITVLLFSINSIAQDLNYKWSVEANYTVVPEEGFGGDYNIIEVGLKYRFVDLGFLQLGFGVNGGFANKNFDEASIDGRNNRYYIQPRLFSEFKIPGIERLRTGIGLGYSILNEDTSVISIGEDVSGNTTNGGFNFNLGVTYDITDRFFVQVQYDFINLNVRDEFIFQGEVIKPDFQEKLNNIKIGVGFRF